MQVGFVASPVDVGTVWSRGGALEVIRWGDGSRHRAVAVHGFLDHGWSWDGLVPALDKVELVSYSARGHGASDRADAYQWIDWVVDLAAVVRDVGGGEPVDVIGHSWGAHVTMELARLAPGLVKRIVNIDGVEADHPTAAAPDLVERVRRVADLPEPRQRTGFASLDDVITRRQQLVPRLPAEVSASFAERGSVNVDGRWQWALDPMLVSRTLPWDGRGDRPLDLATALATIVTPTLLITGGVTEARHLTPNRAVAWEAANHDHIRHQHIEVAGHYVHLEQPGRVARLIEEFLV